MTLRNGREGEINFEIFAPINGTKMYLCFKCVGVAGKSFKSEILGSKTNQYDLKYVMVM